MKASLFLIVCLAAFSPMRQAVADEIYFDAGQWGNVNLVARQASGNVSLEAIVNANNNLERLNNYNANERLRKMSEPVGRLDIRFSDGTFTTCTATLIAEDRILTNNHCVPNLPATLAVKGAITDVTLLMNHYDERNTGDAVAYRVDVSPLETSPSLDYSVLRVEGRAGARWGVARLRADPPGDGTTLLVIHHPGGMPKHVTRGNCLAARPAIDRQGIELYHLCDTLPGSSGAPIFSDNDGAMIGLHRAGPALASPGAVNYGILLAAIDSQLVPRSSLGGQSESAPQPTLVTRNLLNDNRTYRLGDEDFTSGEWRERIGRCVAYSLDVSPGTPERLILEAEVFGAENTSVILDGVEFSFANQEIEPGRKRPNYWSEEPVRVYLTPDRRRPYHGQLRICANPVPDPDKPGDLDDFMVRNMKISGEFYER